MIADHRGLQSLGRVLTIGMSCSLVSSLILLPAYLSWITRNRREETEENTEPVAEEPLANEEELSPVAEPAYIREYPPRPARTDHSRPLSELWQKSAQELQVEEDESEEEILRFPPLLPPETRPEWSQKRSA
jgi:hypothetical protein